MSTQKYLIRLVYLCALIAPSVVGCDCSNDNSGNDGDGGFQFADGATPFPDGGWVSNDASIVQIQDGGVMVTDDTGTFQCQIIQCANRITACGDCFDNDGDGLRLARPRMPRPMR